MGKMAAWLCCPDPQDQPPFGKRGCCLTRLLFGAPPHVQTAISLGRGEPWAEAMSWPCLLQRAPAGNCSPAAAPCLHPFLNTGSGDIFGLSAETANNMSNCSGMFVSLAPLGKDGVAPGSAFGTRRMPAVLPWSAARSGHAGAMRRESCREPGLTLTLPGGAGARWSRLADPALYFSDCSEPDLPFRCRRSSGWASRAEAFLQPLCVGQPMPGTGQTPVPGSARAPCPPSRRTRSCKTCRFAGKAGRECRLNLRKSQLNCWGIKIPLFSLL